MPPKRNATKPKRKGLFDSIGLLVIFAFLVSLHKASFAPLASEYLKGFVGQDFKIAALEAVANIVLIVVNLAAIRIVLLFGKVRLLFLLFLLVGCVDLVFIWAGSFFVVLFGYILLLASFQLIWFCINLLVKRYSREEAMHTNTSKVFAAANISWILGPALGGFLASALGINALFAGMSMMAFMLFGIAIVSRAVFDPLKPSKIKGSLDLKTDLLEFFGSGFLRLHYAVYLILYSYYAMMAVYFPLYMYQLGYSFSQVGIMISLSMLPFVLEYPVGKLADLFGGTRFFITSGFLLIACALALLGIAQNTMLFVLAYALGSVGAALIESLNESLVLKRIHHHKTAMLAIFSTSNIAGWLLGMVVSGLILYFIELRYLFSIFFFMMIFAVILAFKIEDRS